MKNKYLAFVLSEQSREDLLAIVPPKYARHVCHHITLAFDNLNEKLINAACFNINELAGVGDEGRMIVSSLYNDSKGIECFKVKTFTLNHSNKDGGYEYGSLTSKRLDGKYYHLTHSLGEGFAAKTSHDALLDTSNKVRNIGLLITGTIELLNK